MRVGEVVKLAYDRNYGFIRADNFRDDIFFHFSTVVGSNPERWFLGQEVEFDLNEVRRLELGELKAEKEQVASRTLSHKLDETQQVGMTPVHHPRAKRRKPLWREKSASDSENPVPSESNNAEGTTEESE